MTLKYYEHHEIHSKYKGFSGKISGACTINMGGGGTLSAAAVNNIFIRIGKFRELLQNASFC